MPVSFYCVWCGKKHSVPTDSICVRKTKNGQAQLVGECPHTDESVYKFIKQSKYTEAVRRYGKC
jgi:hypothetical protein